MLHQQTVVYIHNGRVPKIALLLLLLLLLLSPSDGHMNFLLHFGCQPVPFITRQVCELLLSPQSQELSSKATKIIDIAVYNFMLCMNHALVYFNCYFHACVNCALCRVAYIHVVTNENESDEVEKLSSTSPLSSATAVNRNNKQQRILYSSLLLTPSSQLRELDSCMPLVYSSSSDFNTAIAILKAI